MQPSSLGYGSESDLARVLISCGQVANSSLGVPPPTEPDNFCGGRLFAVPVWVRAQSSAPQTPIAPPQPGPP
jgi:hypothetical protein